jgi:hypothetical protein
LEVGKSAVSVLMRCNTVDAALLPTIDAAVGKNAAL